MYTHKIDSTMLRINQYLTIATMIRLRVIECYIYHYHFQQTNGVDSHCGWMNTPVKNVQQSQHILGSDL